MLHCYGKYGFKKIFSNHQLTGDFKVSLGPVSEYARLYTQGNYIGRRQSMTSLSAMTPQSAREYKSRWS